MEYYEELENEVCDFKKYLKMTMDLLIDSYKWLKLSEYSDGEDKVKYKNVSDTLYEMFMTEHNNINKKFRGE